MTEPDSGELPLYYRYSARKMFSDISLRARTKIFEAFMEVLRPGPAEKVLDVGATSVAERRESNFFEQMYPYQGSLTGVGVERVSTLKSAFPKAAFIQIQPGQPLPFRDGEFDVAFSNAVLEHVGDEKRQRAFVSEVTRVSRRGMISIPDRRFPIEHHCALPVVHWLPGNVHRSIFRLLGLKGLETIDNLNLIWGYEFRALFDPKLRLETKTVKTLGFPSNLLGFYWV